MRLGASAKSQSKGQTLISISKEKESNLTLMCMNGTPMLEQGAKLETLTKKDVRIA